MDRPKRKQNRLTGFDYSSAGKYFITICTHNREHSLSRIIVGDGFPVPQLTSIGKVADKYISCINDKYPSVFVDNYVIMPNHIHMLLAIAENNPDNIKTGSVVGWFKYSVTKECNSDFVEKVPIFQRSYHDHIIRNEQGYKMIYDYISNNPSVWYIDCYFSEQ